MFLEEASPFPFTPSSLRRYDGQRIFSPFPSVPTIIMSCSCVEGGGDCCVAVPKTTLQYENCFSHTSTSEREKRGILAKVVMYVVRDVVFWLAVGRLFPD